MQKPIGGRSVLAVFTPKAENATGDWKRKKEE